VPFALLKDSAWGSYASIRSTGELVSILTLNKFLLNGWRESEVVVPEAISGHYLDVASRALAAIRRSVLVGETFTDLFEEMDAIRKDLHVENGSEAVGVCATRVEDLLVTYQNRLRSADQDRAADFKSVVEVLNEALTYLTEHDQTSQERREQLENNLSVAARLDDISTLRSHLAKILLSVRDEGRRGRDKAQEVIASLGQQIQQVHKVQSRFAPQLPGRNSAVEHLKPILETTAVGLRMAMFAADALRVIRERHGEEVATSIVQDLGLKRLQPLFQESKVFRWAPNALLLVWRDTDASKAPGDVLVGLKPSYEQRAFVGTRVAVFSITLRSLVIQTRGTMDELILTFDRFSRAGAAC
jgi:hypothetical protein